MTTSQPDVSLPEQIESIPQSVQTGGIAHTRWGEFIIENLIRTAGVSTIIIIGLIFFFLVVFTLGSLLSYSPMDPSIHNARATENIHNLFGRFGAHFAGLPVARSRRGDRIGQASGVP